MVTLASALLLAASWAAVGAYATTVAPQTTTIPLTTASSTSVAIVNNASASCGTPPAEPKQFSIAQMVVIAIIATVLSVFTVVGNCMVMISFKIDKQLQTISNYFLCSLAVADFAIGLISMPLFTVNIIVGYWPLGPIVCDTWLALDYLASNASVLNLLIISFDRYFSVTRPLTYRAKRTTCKAAFMIGSAWGISLLLWPPWIYAWPYIEGQRTVPANECYIQFIETNHYITFGTAIAAFYVPVSVMCFLYYRIWRETKKRQKDLPNLQGGKGGNSSKRSNSSDEQTQVHPGGGAGGADQEDWRRARLESGNDDCCGHGDHHKKPVGGLAGIRAWCVAWWHSGREDFDEDCEEPSDMGYATPVSIETPLQSSVSRCTSLNVIRDPYAGRGAQPVGPVSEGGASPLRPPPVPPASAPRDCRSLPATRSMSNDSVYTIVIRLPPDNMSSVDPERAPSIKMIHEDVPAAPNRTTRTPQPPHRGDSEFNLSLNPSGGQNHLNRRSSHIPDIRIPLNAKIIPKQLAGKTTLLTSHTKQQAKKKKKSQEKKQETKAAKTLSAILLSFIITWTPYNILVLLKPLTNCADVIPEELWHFFYALCYINSTINPMCYALCNASFRRTYVRILTCKWHNRNREAISRGVYN